MTRAWGEELPQLGENITRITYITIRFFRLLICSFLDIHLEKIQRVVTLYPQDC